MKQTAVEWLQQALEDTILTHEQIMQTIGLFEQAKQMERANIIDAYLINPLEAKWKNDEALITTTKPLTPTTNEQPYIVAFGASYLHYGL
jgi:hypothetical protein